MSTLVWTREFPAAGRTLYVSDTGRLPHIHPEDKWLFITWCLHGSLPRSYPPPRKISTGEAFVWLDRNLDSARLGPLYLKQEAIASIVMTSLHKGVALRHYNLGPFVIMANHVHALLSPLIPPARLMQSMKGTTARDANRLLRRTGEPFWQRESYDHWVRNEDEFNRISRYIENNPVKAGIVFRAEDYQWSSAYTSTGVHTSVDTAGTSARATVLEEEIK